MREFTKVAKTGLSLFKPVQSRNIHTQKLNSLENGSFVVALTNDARDGEDENSYVTRSMTELKNALKPDTYHVYVDKSKASQTGLSVYPGHISGFLTNAQNEVRENSFISLRNGKRVDETLIFRFPSDKAGVTRETTLWDIEFYSFEKEFKKHVFKLGTDAGKARFIIGIPFTQIEEALNISEKEFIELCTKTKQDFQKSKYVLCDGTVNGEVREAINCITGFYASHNLVGTEKNPSTQMAAWSFLKFIFGQSLRDSLIHNTGLKDPAVERTHDDILTSKKKN